MGPNGAPDSILAPAATNVNRHLTEAAQLRAGSTQYWKQTAKERRGFKRRCEAETRAAQSSQDAGDLPRALDTAVWTQRQRGILMTDSKRVAAEVQLYERDHVLL